MLLLGLFPATGDSRKLGNKLFGGGLLLLSAMMDWALESKARAMLLGVRSSKPGGGEEAMVVSVSYVALGGCGG